MREHFIAFAKRRAGRRRAGRGDGSAAGLSDGEFDPDRAALGVGERADLPLQAAARTSYARIAGAAFLPAAPPIGS